MKKLMIVVGLVLSTAAAYAGPQCTAAYPKGVVTTLKGTKKRPVRVCFNGDLGATWRSCVQRYSA